MNFKYPKVNQASMFELIRKNQDFLNDWEYGFYEKNKNRNEFTQRQIDTLRQIYEKILEGKK